MQRGQYVAELQQRIQGWKLVLEMTHIVSAGCASGEADTVETRQRQLQLAAETMQVSGGEAAVPDEVKQRFVQATEALQQASEAGGGDVQLMKMQPATASAAEAADVVRMRGFVQDMLDSATKLLAHYSSPPSPCRGDGGDGSELEAWLEEERALRAEEANRRAAFAKGFPGLLAPNHMAMLGELHMVTREATKIATTPRK